MHEHPNPKTAESKLPGMRYTHVSQNERHQIDMLMKERHERSNIAKLMTRCTSPIGRELRRNCGDRSYQPAQAHQQASVRRCTDNGKRISDAYPSLWRRRAIALLRKMKQGCGVCVINGCERCLQVKNYLPKDIVIALVVRSLNANYASGLAQQTWSGVDLD